MIPRRITQMIIFCRRLSRLVFVAIFMDAAAVPVATVFFSGNAKLFFQDVNQKGSQENSMEGPSLLVVLVELTRMLCTNLRPDLAPGCHAGNQKASRLCYKKTTNIPSSLLQPRHFTSCEGSSHAVQSRGFWAGSW